MAGRRDRLTDPAAQRAIVARVVEARACGVGWKQLAWSIGRSRSQLHRLVTRHGEKCDINALEPHRRAVA